MSEALVAWAEDCMVRAEVDLPEGRLSDVVNRLDLLQLRTARLEALDDGHVVEVDELEIERRDLHLVLLEGRAGDPTRQLRTVREQVVMEIGPFTVRGHLHRPPNAGPLAALNGWARFIPVTEAAVSLRAGGDAAMDGSFLVNRERIAKIDLLDRVPAPTGDESWAPPLPALPA